MFRVILFVVVIIIIALNYVNNINYTTLNLNEVNNIAEIITNCTITNIKKYQILTHKEYIIFMNYLSCMCKGIGYWGGFCLNKENYYVGGNQKHDVGLTNELADVFRDKTVVDLGAGLGWYCPIISKRAKKCDQFDGSVNIEEVTKGKVKYLNLAEPIHFECNYDIVMSLEVAEHIPKMYEEIYINNLIKCCKESILITWSRIGQKGHYHVNNKNREDVIKLFERKGFNYVTSITNRLKNATNIWYLKNNILFFNKQRI